MATEKKERVQIKKSEVVKLMEVDRLNRKEMAAHYGLSVGQMNKAMKQMGLAGKKVYPLGFTVVDDTPAEAKGEVTTTKEEDNF